MKSNGLPPRRQSETSNCRVDCKPSRPPLMNPFEAANEAFLKDVAAANKAKDDASQDREDYAHALFQEAELAVLNEVHRVYELPNPLGCTPKSCMILSRYISTPTNGGSNHGAIAANPAKALKRPCYPDLSTGQRSKGGHKEARVGLVGQGPSGHAAASSDAVPRHCDE